MLEMEQSNIQTMLDRQGQYPPILGRERAGYSVERIAEQQEIKLNDNQKSALEQLLASRDQIIGLQGGAGTGKTTALSVLRRRRKSGIRSSWLRANDSRSPPTFRERYSD